MFRFPTMDEGPRFFTVEEANELVTELELEFGRVARVRAELGPIIESIGGADAAVELLQEDGEVPRDARRRSPFSGLSRARSPPPSSASTSWAAW
jgi:hypothetical protein